MKRKRHAWNKYIATKRMKKIVEYKPFRNVTNDFFKTINRDYEMSISQKVKKNPNSLGDMLRVRLNL